MRIPFLRRKKPFDGTTEFQRQLKAHYERTVVRHGGRDGFCATDGAVYCPAKVEALGYLRYPFERMYPPVVGPPFRYRPPES